MFKNKTRLGNKFHFKDQIPKDLTSGVVYKFQCGLCNESYYGECMRLLNVRIGEHIGISPLTRKQVKPKNSSAADHLLYCNHSVSYDNFSILRRENKKFFLELKEILLINHLWLGTLHQHHCTYSTGPSNKIFARILFVLKVATLFLLYGLFYYLVMLKCMSTTVRDNGTVQFTFVFIMRLNITIIMSCDSLIVILVT